MKVFAVGDMSGFDVEDLEGQPAVVLVGSVDEVRNAALLLGKSVSLIEPLDYSKLTDEQRSRLTEGSGAALARAMAGATTGVVTIGGPATLLPSDGEVSK